MIHFEGPPHKRIHTMGVENPNVSQLKKNKLLKNKNYKDLCISFGVGNSKKEGEQKAAKMSLILHGILNQDQYTMNDVYYPDWSKLFKDKSEDSDEIVSLELSDVGNSSELSDETDSDY